MQKIVILGATGGVVKTIEEIRSNDRASEITFLALDGYYPYNRDSFPELITKQVSLNQVLCKPKDFYEKHRVKVVLDKKIVKVNFKKHKIFLENGEPMEYGLLLITDPPDYRFPEMKGIQRKGVLGTRKLSDILAMGDLMPITETVVFQAENLEVLKLAAAFLSIKKEVMIVSANKEMVSSISSQENKSINQALEENNLRFITENPMVEILGDVDVKAVRLQSGKVIATQMVIFTNTPEDFKLFADSPLKINQKICVNAEFKTNIENVLAVHEAAELETVLKENQE